jgi:hypothetical protein
MHSQLNGTCVNGIGPWGRRSELVMLNRMKALGKGFELRVYLRRCIEGK